MRSGGRRVMSGKAPADARNQNIAVCRNNVTEKLYPRQSKEEELSRFMRDSAIGFLPDLLTDCLLFGFDATSCREKWFYFVTGPLELWRVFIPVK